MNDFSTHPLLCNSTPGAIKMPLELITKARTPKASGCTAALHCQLSHYVSSKRVTNDKTDSLINQVDIYGYTQLLRRCCCNRSQAYDGTISLEGSPKETSLHHRPAILIGGYVLFRAPSRAYLESVTSSNGQITI